MRRTLSLLRCRRERAVEEDVGRWWLIFEREDNVDLRLPRLSFYDADFKGDVVMTM